jgi:hypothetical protein
MSLTTRPIWSAVSLRVMRSSPNTLMTTSARDPAKSWFTRSSIGCDTDTNVAGTSPSTAFLMASPRASRSCAVVHSFLSRSLTITSVSSGPTGSVATSARPVRVTTDSTSGKRASTFSTCVPSRCASVMDTDGSRLMSSDSSPSSRRGTNSAPSERPSPPAATSPSTATASVSAGRVRKKPSPRS